MDRLAVDAPRVVAAVAELVYGTLAKEPYRVGKPLLHELVGLYSARRGEYRIVYRYVFGKPVLLRWATQPFRSADY